MNKKVHKRYDFDKMTPSDWDTFIESEDLNTQDEYNRTPLLWTCLQANYHLTKRLIEAGADIHFKGISRNTALHFSRHSQDIAELLIKSGVDVNAVNKFGNTALHLATYQGFVKVLIEAGADIHLKNKEGRTPLEEILNTLQSKPEFHQEIKTIFLTHQALLEKEKLNQVIPSPESEFLNKNKALRL